MIILGLFIVFNIEARPISYSGGTTLMFKSDNVSNSVYLHYSPTYKYSIGIEKVKNKFYDNNKNYLRLTYLLNRKNTFTSQRNLYFQSGVMPNNTENIFYGVHGDWETRKLFIGFGIKDIQSKYGMDYKDEYLQLGFAPYVGDYNDLHTWIMLKTKKNTLTNKASTYPELKFFKGNALMKFGYGANTNWDLHFMYRF
jgi:hypothetical protein|tara:strand:- start:10 stop:600 length:591 start_codon:yes stop_codon:yes gene_type:complete